MAAVSQLVDFANHFRQPPSPGVEVIETSRYRITLQPDFPIPGPNGVAWIRCRDSEADDVIREVRARVAPRHVPIMWVTDPGTMPVDFADYLAARGIQPDLHAPEAAVMVLPVDAAIDPPEVAGLELHDGLANADVFASVDAVSREAFESTAAVDPAQLERRRQQSLAAGNRRFILATVDGEPAGSASVTLFAPFGATINGGAVRPKFRGRGVYRAMVAARLEMARQAAVPGLAVWGGPMSAPILEKLGFEKVGWRRFYPDTSTA